MEKKILHHIAFAGLALGLLRTPPAHADCASIQWSMNEYAYIPILEYIDCNTREWKETGAHYSHTVTDALVGSSINLGPSGTDSNYTEGLVVHPGENKFICSGWYASSGRCLIADNHGCASIEWGMEGYPKTLPPWVPKMEYVSCHTGNLTEAPAHYSGVVHDAAIGSEINLGPSGTDSDYTPRALVHGGENRFECAGGTGCLRIY